MISPIQFQTDQDNLSYFDITLPLNFEKVQCSRDRANRGGFKGGLCLGRFGQVTIRFVSARISNQKTVISNQGGGGVNSVCRIQKQSAIC